MDKLDLIVDKIEDLKDSHDHRLDSIDDNLREHMRRTDALESLHIDNQTRINVLEETPKALRKVKTWAISISGFGGAIIIIYKLVELIKG